MYGDESCKLYLSFETNLEGVHSSEVEVIQESKGLMKFSSEKFTDRYDKVKKPLMYCSASVRG